MSIKKLSKEGKTYYLYSYIFYFDGTNVIGPRIREIFDGHLIVSDVDLYEYKNYPPISDLEVRVYNVKDNHL